MNNELAVILSDIHCGSVTGLAAPDTTTQHGNRITFGGNAYQAWLWKNWQEGVARVKQIIGKSAAILVVNGDATEGVHHNNNAEVLESDIETHVAMAEECLGHFSRLCRQTLVVRGTECHTRNMENLLAERLGAVGSKARDKWLFRVKGCLIDAAHHMPTSGRAYLEASAMSIAMGNARINYLRNGHEIPKVFLRAHRHCGGHYSDTQGLFAVTGAWQFLTRHGHKVVTDSIPVPTILILDWRGKKHGELPMVNQLCFGTLPQRINVL